MKPIEIAHQNFAHSNKSDLASIAELFTDTTIYSSENTGTFLGKDNIIEMQREFHTQYAYVNWEIISTSEIEDGKFLFDIRFKRKTFEGDSFVSKVQEVVTIDDNKILEIEIRNVE